MLKAPRGAVIDFPNIALLNSLSGLKLNSGLHLKELSTPGTLQ